MSAGLLSGDEWRALERAGRSRRFRSRQVLFREGDPGGSVFAVRAGRVKISLHTPDGREIVLAVKEPGELLGELSAIDGRRRSATATAMEPIDAVVVPPDAFNAFIEGHPRLAVGLLRALAAQLRETDRRSAERDTGDIAERVARRLVDLAQRFGEHHGADVEITLRLSHEDLAGWVGASREATSRALGRLRADGCVTTARGRITLCDIGALRRRGGTVDPAA